MALLHEHCYEDAYRDEDEKRLDTMCCYFRHLQLRELQTTSHLVGGSTGSNVQSV